MGLLSLCCQTLRSLHISGSVTARTVNQSVPLVNAVREASFFNRLPAEHLWKGVTSVSNAGKKRGRGKGIGKKMSKDLNRGQIIGVGRANMLWPGLNAPIVRGKELVKQQQLPEDPDRAEKLRKLRDSMGNFRVIRINPIDRGWSGSKMPGRSLGPPDAIGEDTFEGFDSRVLEMKTVFIMKGNMGRKRRMSALVVTGNGKGLAGFALGKGNENRAALRKAKNRSAQKLMYFELCDGHTIFHDFFCQFGKTKIFVTKKPEGHGLVCHRAIKTICEVIGIKDLHAKIEGSNCLQHVVKAFFVGLLQQKTYQQMADEKRLHLVAFSDNPSVPPKVIASPTHCRTESELENNETMDVRQYALGDRIMLKKKKFPPFYTKLRSWEIHLRKQERIRNHRQVRLDMLINHGELRSFLTDKYPECRPQSYVKPQAEASTEEP